MRTRKYAFLFIALALLCLTLPANADIAATCSGNGGGAHSFDSNGFCPLCNGQCLHATTTTYDTTGTYTSRDSSNHLHDYMKDVVECRICHSIVDAGTNASTDEAHAFGEDGYCALCDYQCPHTEYDDKGACVVCGYQCPHTASSAKTDRQWYTDDADNRLLWHNKRQEINIRTCDVCGAVTQTGTTTVTIERHTFIDGKCLQCDHLCAHPSYTDGVCDTCSVPCPHPTDKRVTKNINRVYSPSGDVFHDIIEECDALFCNQCNEKLADGQIKKTSYMPPHEYINSICSLCKHQCTHSKYDDQSTCIYCGYKCSHFNTTTKGEAPRYTDDAADREINHTMHQRTQVIACTACGAVLQVGPEISGTEPHTYDSNKKCTKCGHMSCTHPAFDISGSGKPRKMACKTCGYVCEHTTKEHYTTITYEQISGSSSEHNKVFTRGQKCTLCYEVLTESKTETSEDHEIQSNGYQDSCANCGYILSLLDVHDVLINGKSIQPNLSLRIGEKNEQTGVTKISATHLTGAGGQGGIQIGSLQLSDEMNNSNLYVKTPEGDVALHKSVDGVVTLVRKDDGGDASFAISQNDSSTKDGFLQIGKAGEQSNAVVLRGGWGKAELTLRGDINDRLNLNSSDEENIDILFSGFIMPEVAPPPYYIDSDVHDLVYDGGAGKDIIYIMGNNCTVKTYDGDDQVFITSSGNNVYTGDGNDAVTLSGENTTENVVDTGSGINTINADGTGPETSNGYLVNTYDTISGAKENDAIRRRAQ